MWAAQDRHQAALGGPMAEGSKVAADRAMEEFDFVATVFSAYEFMCRANQPARSEPTPLGLPNPGLERALELLSGVFCLGDDDREKLDKAIAILRGTDGDSRLVTVCSECKQASCWQGKFYCDKAKMAGTVELTVAQLREMALEHPDNWRAE